MNPLDSSAIGGLGFQVDDWSKHSFSVHVAPGVLAVLGVAFSAMLAVSAMLALSAMTAMTAFE